MFETTGSLAIVQPVTLLVGLVLFPLLWTLLAAAMASRKFRAWTPNSGEGPGLSIVSMACALATCGLSIVFASRLAFLPKGYVFVQHVSQLGRLGQLDLAIDLALDPRSATFAVVVALIACASAFQTSSSTRRGKRSKLAWSGLVTAGAMLLCVGDGLAPIVVGLGLLSLGSWGLGGGVGSNVSGTAGGVSVLLGFVFLFWSLGGAFGPAGYDPDGAPRFVLVTTASPSERPEMAMLTMTSHAGALVSSDDADLPGEPIAAPFSILVPPGVYTLRVQGGAASGDIVVPRVGLMAGRSHVLTSYGPTTSLRALDDQVLVPRLAPAGGPASVRSVLTNRVINGLRASGVVFLLVFVGGLAFVHALASRRGPSAIVSVLEALPAPYLALRLSPLVDPAIADGSLIAALGVGSAVILAARAACAADGHMALRGVVAVAAAVSLTVVGLGDPAAAIVVVCTVFIATSAALLAIEARRDVRWLGVACAAAVGLLPGAGASSGYVLAVSASLDLATRAALPLPAAVFAVVVAASLVVANAFTALAAFRVYDAMISAAAKAPGASKAEGAVVIVLAVVALFGGVVLGVGTTAFGGRIVPIVRRLTGPGNALPSAPNALSACAALLLSLGGAASGVLLARRASDSSSPPRWLMALGRPYGILTSTVEGLTRGVRFLERSVRSTDRDVIDEVPAAIQGALGWVTSMLVRTERKISGEIDPRLDRAAGVVLLKLELAEPRKAERGLTVVLFAMVALLGLVVLSSLLLG